MAVRLPPAGLFNELAEELVLKLGVGQTHLQGTLGQRDVVIDGRSVDGHVNEKLASLRRDVKKDRHRMRDHLCSRHVRQILFLNIKATKLKLVEKQLQLRASKSDQNI